MYVMSSLPPSQQSLAGGIFQTVTKLSLTVGLGVSTAVFDAVRARPAAEGFHANDPFEPYAAVMFYCAAVAACAVPLVLVLRIGTQGDGGGGREGGGERRGSGGVVEGEDAGRGKEVVVGEDK